VSLRLKEAVKIMKQGVGVAWKKGTSKNLEHPSFYKKTSTMRFGTKGKHNVREKCDVLDNSISQTNGG